MEDNRDDLVVIMAGYKDRIETFFRSNPGMGSRIAHHIDFPDYSANELFQIAGLMVRHMNYELDEGAATAMRDYIKLRMQQPRFSNARSIRNALDRTRLRMANRLSEDRGRPLSRADLQMMMADDIKASRVFAQGPDGAAPE